MSNRRNIVFGLLGFAAPLPARAKAPVTINILSRDLEIYQEQLADGIGITVTIMHKRDIERRSMLVGDIGPELIVPQ